MEYYVKKTLSFSSSNPLSSENDENESENQRNSLQIGAKSQHQSKQSPIKNFMAPTISAASKSLSPKKKILNFGSKSISRKVGISNASRRKSLSTIPPLSSPNMVLESDGDSDEEDGFVPNSSSTRPYDPLTNYLSPRPKFLRYNPNRRRGIVLRREERISPGVSLESQGSSETSLMQENGDCEQQVMVEKQEEEEEVIGEKKWGLKWELFKLLIVFAVLVLSTMYILSMNSHLRVKVEHQNSGNRTLEGVSLSNLEFGYRVFVGKEESEMGLFEIYEIAIEHEGRSRNGDLMGYNEVQISEKIEPLKDYYQMVVQHDTDDDSEPSFGHLNKEQVENEVSIIVQPSSQETEEENLVFESVSQDELVESEEQMVGSDPNKLMEEEILVFDYDEVTDSEPKSKDGQLENEPELVVENPNDGIQDGNEADYEMDMVESESKFMDEHPEIESENVAEDGHKQFWWTSKNVIWVVISSLMTTLMSSLAVRLYFKCKKASLKAVSSILKPCFKPRMVEKTPPRLPPTTPSRKEEQHEKTPRIIPKVELLSEFAVVGDFSLQSEMQESEAPNQLQPEFSTPDSLLYRNRNSQEKTTKEENGKDEKSKATPTPLRRSSRIRNRGVTSP